MYLKSFFILAVFLAVVVPVSASERVSIEVLGRQDCVHCDDEKAFFEWLSEQRDDFSVRWYDIDLSADRALFDRVTESEGLSKSTPITLVGATIIQGFDSTETTGRRIETLIDSNKGEKNYGFEGLLAAGGSEGVEKTIGGTCDTGDICVTPGGDPFFVSVPLIGEIDVTRYSLPALSSVLGFVDGFNPCAMWVLVTFLLVLVQLGDRRKVWTVAGLFIVAEAVMYYLILNVWFGAWDFVGLDRIVTPIVGLVAIGGGLFFLYEWLYADGTCQVTDISKRAKISGQIRKLATEPFTWLTVGGVVALALSVNVIEFACSVGIPQAFTKIVEMNGLGFLETQGLMALYILFYMIDDVIVFGFALWGAGKLAQTGIYVKWCNLFGGLLMVALGALLLFKPEWLRF
ncbi:MAG: glutaredoxin [Candidatus Moranbacteria bacterium]|nr:glutaredoxin [Candidatus Moranbacteria bacterium]